MAALMRHHLNYACCLRSCLLLSLNATKMTKGRGKMIYRFCDKREGRKGKSQRWRACQTIVYSQEDNFAPYHLYCPSRFSVSAAFP
ncbi:hypothetical protein FPV67DRAFT_1479914, partial [Lyophyllum atratum]